MLAIINARLETITNGIMENAQILIDLGKITAIGSNLNIPANAKIIDAQQRTVTPGLIEAHAHIGISEQGIGWEGNDTNETTDPTTPCCRAIDGINMRDQAFQDFRSAGITTVNILPGSSNLIGGSSVAVKCKPTNIVDEAIILHPSGMKAALGENPKKTYSKKSQAPATRMGNAALLREALLKAKQYWEKKNQTTTTDELKVDQKAEALIPVIKGEIPLRIHCHRADDIITAIRIAQEFQIKYTLEHVTDGYLLIDYLKSNTVSNAVGPTIHYGSKVENRDRDFRTAVYLARAGANFCLTTDHPVVAGQYLAVTAALAVGWGMKREIALNSITLAAAKHIGIADRVGSLEIGKDADLVIWSGDPLEFTTFADLTMIDGQIVFQREVD